ncbi:MAG: hypothetical protein ABH834_00155 [Candidatus Altiarchaeota archaeon]
MHKWGVVKHGIETVSGRRARKAVAAARAYIDQILSNPEYTPEAVSQEASEWAAGNITTVGRHDILEWKDAFEEIVPTLTVDQKKQADDLTEFLNMDAAKDVNYPLDHRVFLMAMLDRRLITLAVEKLGYSLNKLTSDMGSVALREVKKKLTPEKVKESEQTYPEGLLRTYEMLNYAREDYHAHGF